MGSVESYYLKGPLTAKGEPRREDLRYRVLYRRPDHRQTSKRGFARKRDAELFLASVELDKSRGAYIDPAKARVTVDDWLTAWLATRTDLRATSLERAEGIVRRHITPTLGRYPLGELTHSTVQAWASRLLATQSPSSVRKIVNVLSGALTAAQRDGRIPANPAHGLKLPKVVTGAKVYLSHDEVAWLAAAVDEIGRGPENGARNGYGLLVRVLAYCGLRWGELSGLRVRDVDLQRGRLEVSHTVVEVGGVQHESTPKDYEARSIPVPASIVAELRAHIAGRAPDDPAFPGSRGNGWLRGRVFRRGWLDAAAAAIDRPGLTPHELRHTAASLAISAGANVKAVQRMLGHASAAVTLDVYSDLFDDDLDTVSAALDQAIRRTDVARTLPPPGNEEGPEPTRSA
ncbi:tyrosine-type recombinase/integrase [Rathayibacter sp. VKM Ac-2762]|uniref:tyrosine-type recombinase/integrase n=1 Tax=Rathayibacter sp. VKM Ac-2762 TaxID=2609254 RepID=UPI00132F32C9|nr:site-specific integrase [Rathayibacter sp. VKM Ac-2762]QHF19844.1 tyrosine-type recombinase/integrase [Rathayibacter sp. VKM Ac-2762]